MIIMKGSTLEKCVEKAEKYIDEKGICLLLFDVKNSKKYSRDRYKEMFDTMKLLMEDINKKFSDYLPLNSLRIYDANDIGFVMVKGDSACAGVNSHIAVEEIIKYQKEKYPYFELWWEVAEDGWDECAKYFC